MNQNSLTIFENYPIRRIFDKESQQWFFSVVDIVSVLTESPNSTDYLKKMRKRDFELNSYIGTNCPQIQMKTKTNKNRKTLAANMQSILRIVQSIPSSKAESIKLWLAKVGTERIQEIADPEQSLNRARGNWRDHGRSEKWIQQRMMGQETRNKLTDYWSQNEVANDDYKILTGIIHKEWSGVSVGKHKEIKGLKSQNLRDHMTEAELLFTALAEMSTRQIAESVEAKGLEQNKSTAKKGGSIAKHAKLELEAKTGKKVVSDSNFLPPKNNPKSLK